MSVKDLKDFARLITQTLDFKEQVIPEWFSIEETKDGYFVAVLQKGKWLGDLQFKALCALMRDLKGDYVKGTKMFQVPGPCAKKSPEKPSQPIRKEPDGVTPQSVAMDKSKPPIVTVPVAALLSMPFQSRKQVEDSDLADLVESIKVYGILEPILVRPKTEGLFEVVAGERRVAAAKKAGVVEVPVCVKFLNDQEAYEVQLIENVQRRDLTDMEKARMLDFMIKQFGYTQEALAQKLGKDKTWVSHHLTMLELGKVVPGQPVSQDMTERQAREILAAPADKQEEILNKINETGEIPSTRELHEMVHPKPKTVPCERCGDPIEGPAIHSKGKFYCTDCAEILKTERPEPEGVPEPEPVEGEGRARESVSEPAKPKHKPEALLTGYPWTCPECGDKYIINHVDWPGSDHREHRLEVCKK